MPVKGNQFKSNNFKQENQPRQPSTKADKGKNRPSQSRNHGATTESKEQPGN